MCFLSSQRLRRWISCRQPICRRRTSILISYGNARAMRSFISTRSRMNILARAQPPKTAPRSRCACITRPFISGARGGANISARRWPAAFDGKALTLLTKPDKNAIESKALNAAAAALGISAGQLMIDCGAIASARALHHAYFLAEYFPHGAGFGTAAPYIANAPLDELPQSGARAFSIDDLSTTEIDDAFSVEALTNGRLRIGIHIAAPALGIARGDSTVPQARGLLPPVTRPAKKSRCCQRPWWSSLRSRKGATGQRYRYIWLSMEARMRWLRLKRAWSACM